MQMSNTLESIRSDLSQNAALKDRSSNYKFLVTPVGDDVLEIPKEDILSVVRQLRSSGRFDILMDLCGADYPERAKRFEVVYHFFSTKTLQRLRLKCQVGEDETIESLTPVWDSANWFEREAWDMFGIKFTGHPNLRRLLVHEEFVGHPLRKDYDADHQQHCSVALPVHFDPTHSHLAPESKGKNLVPLNIGPSHPSTHGTLRVMAELDGETIARANVELGFLHRCFEKMAETHPYNQVIPYTDRLNYCSAPMNNVGYCKAVERLLGVEIPQKAQAMRVILAELSRIIDHIVCLGANAVDLGALTAFFQLFTYREKPDYRIQT